MIRPDEEKTLTIAHRTRKNLDFMYAEKAKGANVEEFTHLLNSMLGMVICLREEYFKGREVTWQAVEQLGLKPITINCSAPNPESPRLSSHTNFSQLITNIRHAFAHNNFTLRGNPKGQITGILAWNIQRGRTNEPQNRVWEADISEQQLKDLAYLFIDYIEHELKV